MGKINYWTPIERAWNRMVTVLFRPFDLGKWMVIGFTAFLANCGRSSGSGSSGGGNSGGGNPFGNQGSQCGQGNDFSFREMVETVQDYCINFWEDHAALILLCTILGLLLIVAISVLVSWINSRGQFMFLDNVLKNRGAVKEPWATYRREANSLMVFQVLFEWALLFIVLILLFGIVLSVLPMLMAEQWMVSKLLAIGFILLVLLVSGWVFSFIRMVLSQFIVPLMYQRRISVREGWSVFSALLKRNFWRFILYGLMLFVVDLVLGMAILLGILLTCCTAFLLLVIPYIGTVVVLPIYVFRRFIGVEFLRQFGEEFDVFPVHSESSSESQWLALDSEKAADEVPPQILEQGEGAHE